MPAVDPRLILVFIWIAGVTAAALWLLRRRPAPLPPLLIVLLLALAVRLLPALLLPRGARYEMSVFRQAGELTLAGESVYLQRVAHPYLPFQLYWYAAAWWLAQHVGLFFEFWVKLLNILAETAIVGLIYQAVQRQRGQPAARYASLFYALNPVTIMVSSYQGQFDAVPMLFLLFAWYGFTYGRAQLAAALALGAAVLSKTWPVLMVPILVLRQSRWSTRLRLLFWSLVVPLVGILFYEWLFPGSLTPMLRRAARAGSIPGWWGYSAVLNVLVTFTGFGGGAYALLNQMGRWLALLLAGLVIWLMRRQHPLYTFMLVVLVLFAFVPNLGVQGLSWIVPLAIILGYWNELGWYTVGAVAYMWTAYWGIHLTDGLMVLLPKSLAHAIIQLASLFIWLPIVLWLAQEVRQRDILPAFFHPNQHLERTDS